MGTKPHLAFLFLLATLSFSTRSLAEEAPKPEATPNVNAAEQKAVKDLMDLEKQIGGLQAKITAKQQSVEALLKQKNEEKDPEKLSEIVKLVQQEHREMEKLKKEYNTQVGILNYRHPERGVTQSRRYQRLSTKSLEEMEKSLGLDAHLARSRKKAKLVYGISDEKPKSASPKKAADPTQEESVVNPALISK